MSQSQGDAQPAPGQWVVQFDDGTRRGIRIAADMPEVLSLVQSRRIGPFTLVIPPGYTQPTAAAAVPALAELFDAADRARALAIGEPRTRSARLEPRIPRAAALRFWGNACGTIAILIALAALATIGVVLLTGALPEAKLGTTISAIVLATVGVTVFLTLHAIATGVAALIERG